MTSKRTPPTARGIRDVFIYLHVSDGVAAIDFYKRVFGARERLRLAEPNGRIAHAELEVGPVIMMLADEHPESNILSPSSVGGAGMTIHLHVDDVDYLAQEAVEAGATMIKLPTDEGHGERQCRFRDPFGHEWLLGQESESLTADEIKDRFDRQFPDDHAH